MLNLTSTQRTMIAASLEIDGRADIAAGSVIAGHITEFTYRNGSPASSKAQQLEALKTALAGSIELLGVEATAAALRS